MSLKTRGGLEPIGRRRSGPVSAGRAIAAARVRAPSPPSASRRHDTLKIDVVWSDITSVKADVLLVGHYLGVVPQTAELKLDRLISGHNEEAGGKLLITELTKRGALRGELGEVMLFPSPNGRVVALGGMGSMGTFRGPQLRVLARSVAQVIGLLPAHKVLATVLIGSGKGNLRVEEAAGQFLEGLSQALDADVGLRLDRVKLVEVQLDRALEVLAAVTQIAQRLNDEKKDRGGIVLVPTSDLVDGIGGRTPADFGCSMVLAALAKNTGKKNADGTHSILRAVLAELPADVRETVLVRLRQPHGDAPERQAMLLRDIAMNFRLRETDGDGAPTDIPSRIAFWRSDDDIRATAITNTTTVTERAISRRGPLVERASEQLQNPDPDKLQQQAASLSLLLVPPELRDVLKRADPLVIEVDRALARVPWEVLPASLEGEPLAVARPVARQLRTFYSPRPFDLAGTRGLKALVIGDPGGLGLALPEARKEAQAVAKTLGECGVESLLLLGPPEEGTGAGEVAGVLPADLFEVVVKLLTGEFDIVHYSGHATFDPAAPDRAGWAFKGGLLTAYELDGMDRPPRLVVANACLSSQVSPSPEPVRSNATARSRQDSALVAGLADEFFKRGVSDYIGAAWEVPSEPAQFFATAFYRALLTSSEPIGRAMFHARRALYERKDYGAAWAAYQHYGDPTRSIISRGAQ